MINTNVWKFYFLFDDTVKTKKNYLIRAFYLKYIYIIQYIFLVTANLRNHFNMPIRHNKHLFLLLLLLKTVVLLIFLWNHDQDYLMNKVQ